MNTATDKRSITNNKKIATILIVDGSPASLGLLFDYLRGFGFRVLIAEDGESALVQVNYARPDLILLEAAMTGIDGFETCRRLKANEKSKDIPVIFITALSHPVDKMKAFKAGAVDYITKPLQCEEILAHITTHLTIHNLQKSLQRQNECLQQENTRHKRFLAALQESSERYRLLVDNSTDIISRQTPEGVYRYVSPACQTLLGYETEEMLGHSMFDFFHPEDLQAIKKNNVKSQEQVPMQLQDCCAGSLIL